MTPITMTGVQLLIGVVMLGLTIGGVVAAGVRRSARAQALDVAREEVARHAATCAWRSERDHLAGELKYIRDRVDSIADFLRYGKRIES